MKMVLCTIYFQTHICICKFILPTIALSLQPPDLTFLTLYRILYSPNKILRQSNQTHVLVNCQELTEWSDIGTTGIEGLHAAENRNRISNFVL